MSMRPEPHIPCGGISSITFRMMQSSSMRTASMAPSPARMPLWICAPSNAGPAAAAQASTRPLPERTISAFVPMSTAREYPSCVCISVDKTTQRMSEPKYPALFGRTDTSPSGCIGSPSSPPVRTVCVGGQVR